MTWILIPRASRGLPVVAAAAQWSALKIGAGGFITGFSQANDGTMFKRTDTAGAYKWNPSSIASVGNDGSTGAWEQLVRVERMPADIAAMPELYNDGVYEIVVAPNDSSVLYMGYLVFDAVSVLRGVYKSIDGGGSWTRLTGFAAQPNAEMHANRPYKRYGPKAAVYPTDKDTCFFSTGTAGLMLTKNGGTTWTALTSGTNGLPAAVITAGLYCGYVLAFHPSTPTTLWAYAAGIGLYKSTNASANAATISFTQIAAYNAVGKPQGNLRQIAVFGNGNLAVVDEQETLWTFNGTTWTSQITSATLGQRGVSVDPNNLARAISGAQDGYLIETSDSGVTYGTFSNNNANPANVPVLTSGDVPWLGVMTTLIDGGIHFDTQTANKIWAVPAQRGVQFTQLSGPVSNSTTVAYTGQSRGIEQLVANHVVCTVTNQPILATWDSPVFKPDIVNNKYATAILPVNDGGLTACWSIDAVGNFVLMTSDGYYGATLTRNYFSSDYGTNWTAYTAPTGTAATNCQLACASSTNWLFAKQGTVPWFTTNGGATPTWTPATFAGSPSFGGFTWADYNSQRPFCADRVNIGTFYCALGGVGFYRSTDNGANFSQMKADATVSNSASFLRASPFIAGDLWYAPGYNGEPGKQPTAGNALQRSTDGGANWSTFSSTQEVYCVGFGAPLPSQGTYLYSVYIVGWVSSVFGVWRSDDYGSTWNQLRDSAGGGAFPQGTMDTAKCIEGDPGVWNRCYVGYSGSGFRKYN